MTVESAGYKTVARKTITVRLRTSFKITSNASVISTTRPGGFTTDIPTDLYFEYVVLALAQDNMPASYITDFSTYAHTLTPVNDAWPLETHPFIEGYYSNYFDGTGDYLTVPNNDAHAALGTSDFTLELWFNQTVLKASDNYIISHRVGDYVPYIFWINSTGSLRFYVSSTNSSWNLVNDAALATITLSKWYHLAYTRNGNTFKVFLDGVQVYTFNSGAVSFTTTSNPLNIGGQSGGADNFTGYISNVRFVKGTSLYNGPFTPPNTPLLKVANTAVLTAQSETFIDNSPNGLAITRNGDVKVTQLNPFNIVPKEVKQPNTYSYYFDGSGDYLSMASNSALALPGDFTVESWVYVTSFAAERTIIDLRGATSTVGFLGAIAITTGYPFIYKESTGTILTSSTAVTSNAWTHVAFVRSGTTLVIYVNGINCGSTTDSTSWSAPNTTGRIGANKDASSVMLGYISNLRVVKGTAVYTGNFTVPTTPLVEWGVASSNVNALVSANTSLITCKSLTLKDDGPNNFTLTVNGNTRPVLNSPFFTTDTISLTGNEGSINFDGTSDYITIPYHPSFNIPASTPFTFEFWYYSTSTQFAVIANRNWAYGSSGPTYSFSLNNGTTPSWGIAGTGSATYVMMPDGIAGKLGQWNHYVFCRDANNVCRMFTNGEEALSSTRTDSQALTSTSGSMYIGVSSNLSSVSLFGQLSNLRFVVGSCLYTSSFIPPNTQLTPVANTVLMTAMTAQPRNNLQFIDESGLTNIMAENGTVRKGSFSPYSANWSTAFDGSADYLGASAWPALTLAGDFTIEFWVYFTTLDTAERIPVNCWNTGSGWLVSTQSSAWNFKSNGAFVLTYSGVAPAAGQWYHVAVSRSGSSTNNVKMYINGTKVTEGTTTNTITPSAAAGGVVVGAGQTGSGQFINGYVSNFRILNGTALYTSNTITVPTKPLEPVANTVLLLCNTNDMFKDSGPHANATITVAANTRVSAYSPFQNYDFEPKSYSVRYNGSSYTQIPGPTNANVHPAFGLSTGDFTVECWYYHFNDTFYLFDFRNSSDGTGQTRYELAVGPTYFTLVQGSSPSGDRINVTGLSNTSVTWNHVAVVRTNGKVNLYHNGSNIGVYSGVDNLGFSSTLTIGTVGDSPGYATTELNGYVSNFRVSKSAVYTGNFTVPTGPLGLTQSAGTNINALVAVVENGGSVTFDSNGDYLTSSASSSLAFGTGDFTVECWVNFASISNRQDIAWWGVDGSDRGGLIWNLSTNTLTYYISPTVANAIDYAFTPVAGKWYHIALVRISGSTKLYIDGTQGGAIYSDSKNYASSSYFVTIGKDNSASSSYLNGYLSNFRIVKGTGVYTGNSFVVPTVPLTAVTGTSLLTCQGDAYDRSANATTITVNGNSTGINSYGPFGNTVQYLGYQSNAIVDVGPHNLNHQTFFANVANVSTFNPFGYNTNVVVYTPNVMGSSFYSPSTSDYIYVATPADSTYQTLGTQDFTAETWLYSATNGASTGHNLCRPGTLTNTWALQTYNNKLEWLYNAATLLSGGSVRANTWSHLAIVRSNGVSKAYVNGIEVASAADTNNYSATPTNRPIGPGGGGAGGPYMSDFRLTKKALYKSNFVPSTRPLVPLPETMLQTDNRVATIDFSTMNDLSTEGDARISAVNNPYYDNYSYYFDGSGDYLTVAPTNNSEFNFGTGNFTVECWVNFSSLTSPDASNYQTIFGINTAYNTTGNFIFLFNYPSSTNLSVLSSYSDTITSSTNLLAGRWYHIAFVRSSATQLQLFVNGALVGSATISSSNTYGSAGAGIIIGSQNGFLTRTVNGYISNLRVVKGKAVYTGTFTPPTKPLLTTNDSGSNVVALNAIAENETSLYFDGVSDSVAFTANSATVAFASSNYTIECWFYLTAAGGTGGTLGSVYQNLISMQDTQNSQGPIVRFGNGGYNYMLGFTSYGPGTSNSRWANLTQVQALNTWNHVAVVKNNNQVRLYLNGNLQLQDSGASPTTFTTEYYTDAYNLTMPNKANIGDRLYGYISNMRVVKGQAVYTGNSFVVPTSPLGLTQNASTNIAAIVNTITDNGKSVYFNGFTDYITIPNKEFLFGTKNFTVECWVYNFETNSSSPIVGVFRESAGTSSNSSWALRYGTSNTFSIQYYTQGGSFSSVTSSPTYSLNSWNHLAMVRNGTQIYLYVNGVLSANNTIGTNSLAGSGITTDLGMAADYSGLSKSHLLISNLRIVRDQAIYSGNSFVVSTSPLGLTQDASANIAAIVETIPDAGGSVYFDGSGDYLSSSGAAVANFGTGDFTFETWFNVSIAMNSSEWDIFEAAPTAGAFQLYKTATNNLLAYGSYGSTGKTILDTANITSNTWFHVAICRSGSGSNNVGAFVNGVRVAQFTDTTDYNQTGVTIGGRNTGTNFFTGYISNMRAIKGQALYTGNFTVPTSSLTVTDVGTSGANVATSITGTVTLLTCQTPRIQDRSPNPITITVNGNTVVDNTRSPFGYSNVILLTCQGPTIIDNSLVNNSMVLNGSTSVVATESPFGYSNVSLLVGQNYGIGDNSLNKHTMAVAGNVVVSKAFSPFNPNVTVFLSGKDRQFKDISDANLVITRTGNVAVSAIQPFITSNQTELGSLYFDGTGDYLISHPNSDSFAFGTSDFTVECWAYIDDGIVANTKVICGTNLTANGHIYGISSTNKLYVANSASAYTSTGATLTNRQWHHIAFTRSGGTLRMFLDGVLDYSTTAATSLTELGFGVGGRKSGDYPFIGFIDDLRVTKGTARYTANFTPPIRTWVLK